jgi:hypothetical protein
VAHDAGLKQDGTLMPDDTPYIIVDNKKIAPVSRLSKPGSASDSKPNRQDHPYGVIDRVSISTEAMEKNRQLQRQSEAQPPAYRPRSGNPQRAIPVLGNDPPIKRR